MKSTALIDELMELSDPKEDKKIVNTFKTKDTLCLDIFDKNDNGYVMKKEIKDKANSLIKDNFGKKKNVVAIVEIDVNDGKMDRTTFFDRKEITAIAVPKKFHVNYETNEILLYAIYGKKERFGVMSINE